jgi:hypothetical protein
MAKGRHTIATALVMVVALMGVGSVGAAPDIVLKRSTVKIATSGFDFGGRTWVAGGLTGSGELVWRYDDGEVEPSLQGYLHLDNVGGRCARMRLDYYGGSHVRLTTGYGGTVCTPDDRHRVWAVVSLDPYSSSKLNEVKVSIEIRTEGGNWAIAGSQAVQLNPIRSDSVRIALPKDSGADFGNSTFVGGNPLGSGALTWRFVEGKLTPRLTGVLHLSSAAGSCARVRLEYHDADGDELADEHGGSVCATDNRRRAANVDLAPYGHAALRSVTVALQRQVGGDWVTFRNRPGIYGGTPPRVTVTSHVTGED